METAEHICGRRPVFIQDAQVLLKILFVHLHIVSKRVQQLLTLKAFYLLSTSRAEKRARVVAMYKPTLRLPTAESRCSICYFFFDVSRYRLLAEIVVVSNCSSISEFSAILLMGQSVANAPGTDCSIEIRFCVDWANVDVIPNLSAAYALDFSSFNAAGSYGIGVILEYW